MMRRILTAVLAISLLSSCSLLDPNGFSYNPDTAPNCFGNYDCSYIPDSMITTYSIAGEHHIIFK